MTENHVNEISSRILESSVEVHRVLGPGLFESTYQAALQHELDLNGVPYRGQQAIDVRYKELTIPAAYRVDLLVADCVVVEIKSVLDLQVVHKKQLLSYLKLSHCQVGLLLNFNRPTLRDGITRLVVGDVAL